ncbi:MAG: hypothetical protein K2F57_02295, partial [Candidatus Gastranaerophilales bacterium]|nr:hypothetical protein [Candidatus Gastranaerophilales bacterium]
YNRVQAVEERLKKIFEDELNSRDSILVSYKPAIISKLAKYLSGNVSRPASIGIAGETASGKSTITLDIIDTIKSFATEFEIEDAITRVNTDDYYYDRSEMVKAAGSFAEFAKNYDLDVPQALELELMSEHIKELLTGKSVFLPKYDMSGTAKRFDNHTLAHPSKIIISEGLFALTEKIKDAFDFKIYVDVKPEVQKERFFVRAAERDLGESAKGIYKNASQKAEIYIRPCKNEADIVLSGEAVRARYKAFLNKLINIVQQENFRNKVIL